MQEIKCRNCGKLLGEFEGLGKIKCPRHDCRSINKFNTQTGKHSAAKARKSTPMSKRTTASGVTFR